MNDLSALLGDWIIGPAHIGHVVSDMEAAIEAARALYGFSADAVRYEPAPGVEAPTRFAFFEVGGLQFEYIQPVAEQFRRQLLSAPSGGGGINHIAWRVSDIEAAVAGLSAQGILPGYVTPDGIIAIGGKKMVYLDPDTTGGLMIELLEYGDD